MAPINPIIIIIHLAFALLLSILTLISLSIVDDVGEEDDDEASRIQYKQEETMKENMMVPFTQSLPSFPPFSHRSWIRLHAYIVEKASDVLNLTMFLISQELSPTT